MNVLLLGSGGREHALAWKLAQSPLLEQLFTLPGNPGTAAIGKNLSGEPGDIERIKEVIIEHAIDMVVVGPEDPLVNGIHDQIRSYPATSHVVVVGPRADGAMLEGSKAFAKAFMQRHGIPTARYQSFGAEELKEARVFLRTLSPPYVLKVDGLAAGKGVVIHQDLEAADEDLHAMLIQGRFGEAGSKVVIEEYLSGIEVSVFVLTDGHDYLLLPEAKDYKRIGEGDTGPNTGGMGSISPVPFFTEQLRRKVDQQVIKPTITGLQADQISYSGFIFFGLMIVDGEPFVIEYNVRMGDPETESVIPRIKGDLLEVFRALGNGQLNQCQIEYSSEHVATVMLVSAGYPGAYDRGMGITLPPAEPGTLLFHAGTSLHGDLLVTNGGRVMAVTSMGSDLNKALAQSYRVAESVLFQGRHFRHDLGQDLI